MKDFNIVYWKEGEWWVAKCLENSVASQGKTLAEAKVNIREALELSVEDDILQDYNIQNVKTERLSLATS